MLINVEAGADKKVLESIRKIPEIKASNMVYGIYDIVATIQSESLEKLREMVTKKIRQLDEVRSTVTMIVIED